MIRSILLFVFIHLAWNRWTMAGEIPIRADALQFSYQTDDGSEHLACQHSIENAASQDWKVECKGSSTTSPRTYSVHLWVTAYPQSEGPSKIKYEILFWVNDSSVPRVSSNHGTTLWFSLRDSSDIQQLDMSQIVENGSAELNLVWTPPAMTPAP